MKIIVGLGNPGEKYQHTRHNAGYLVVEKIPSTKSQTPNKFQFSNFKIQNKFKAEAAEGEISGEKILLVKPVTFMNLSGEAVGEIFRFYKDRILLNDIIVVHDDMDLELGRIKVQKGGASAGHHGIESIIQHVGSGDFNRVRVGVRSGEGKAMEFVLSSFNIEEQELFEKEIERAAEAIKTIITDGIGRAMNEYNNK